MVRRFRVALAVPDDEGEAALLVLATGVVARDVVDLEYTDKRAGMPASVVRVRGCQPITQLSMQIDAPQHLPTYLGACELAVGLDVDAQIRRQQRQKGRVGRVAQRAPFLVVVPVFGKCSYRM